ncbi:MULTISPECIES: hypothetical protein [Alphaproteobacteria]|uniref:Uncharacterized protein n=1 Tax=Pannonibacter phragmitetus TaxID=121719 RepID=A0A0U3NCQ5_9HYPH|nr:MULTISPECIES: hypothetical protein [Alphaproteobacteria]ALV27392.1 hypothetical protein APZ00_10255 [Pannonibacter phragmitetus]
MTDFTAATLLRRIEEHAPQGAAEVFAVWKGACSDGWTSDAFADALEQLINLDYVEVVGDRVVLKDPQIAVAPQRQQ